jgi:hypothetical protein
MNAAMTGDEFIGRGHELVPLVKTRAPGGGTSRLPEDTFRGFQDAGLFAPSSLRVSVASSCSQQSVSMKRRWRSLRRVERLVFAVPGIHQWHIALFSSRARGVPWGDDPTALSSSS